MKGYNLYDIEELRFVHYFKQIEFIRRYSRPEQSILIIGPGDYIISDFLKRQGFKVKTLDIDISLEPNFLCDLKDIIFNVKEHFDLILISEVLEHLNWQYIPQVLFDLSKIADRLLISVPYAYLRLFGHGDSGKIRIYKDFHLISDAGLIQTRIPYFFWTPKKYPDSDTESHKWCIGYKGYSQSKFRKEILREWKIIEEKIHWNTDTIFWLCEVKDKWIG